jgi:hypothetical protein
MKMILAIALSVIALSVGAEQGDERLKHRVDQDAVMYVDANMMWGDNCEFQLNSRVSRVSVKTDGKIADGDDWLEILNFMCDSNAGLSGMF